MLAAINWDTVETSAVASLAVATTIATTKYAKWLLGSDGRKTLAKLPWKLILLAAYECVVFSSFIYACHWIRYRTGWTRAVDWATIVIVIACRVYAVFLWFVWAIIRTLRRENESGTKNAHAAILLGNVLLGILRDKGVSYAFASSVILIGFGLYLAFVR